MPRVLWALPVLSAALLVQLAWSDADRIRIDDAPLAVDTWLVPDEPRWQIVARSRGADDAEIAAVQNACACFPGIPPHLLCGLVEKESGWNHAAVGDGGRSKGLTQVQSCWLDEYREWHSWFYGVPGSADRFDPVDSLLLACIVLEYYSVHEDCEFALRSYNGGSRGRNSGKCRRYARRVLELSKEYAE